MHIAVFTYCILIIPAALSKPQGCPCDAHSPLRCKDDCSQADTKDFDDGQPALRQGQDNYYTNADNRFKSNFRNPYESHRQSIQDLMKENANQIGGIVPGKVPGMVPGMVSGMVPNMVSGMVSGMVPGMMPGRVGWGSLTGSWG